MRGAGFGGAEHFVDRAAGLRGDRRAELLGERHLAEGSLGPQVGDGKRFLE